MRIPLIPLYQSRSHRTFVLASIYSFQQLGGSNSLTLRLHVWFMDVESLQWRSKMGADHILEHPIDPVLQETVRECRPSSYIGFDRQVRVGMSTHQDHTADRGCSSSGK